MLAFGHIEKLCSVFRGTQWNFMFISVKVGNDFVVTQKWYLYVKLVCLVKSFKTGISTLEPPGL